MYWIDFFHFSSETYVGYGVDPATGLFISEADAHRWASEAWRRKHGRDILPTPTAEQHKPFNLISHISGGLA